MSKSKIIGFISLGIVLFIVFAAAGAVLIWAAKERNTETCTDWTYKHEFRGKICGTCGDSLICQSQCPKTAACFCDKGFFDYKCLNTTPSFGLAPSTAIGGIILSVCALVILIGGIGIGIYLIHDKISCGNCCQKNSKTELSTIAPQPTTNLNDTSEWKH